MKKKLALATIVLLVALAALTVALAACNPTLDPNALNILGKTSDLAKPYMTEIFDLYRQTGKKLNIIAVEDSEYETTALKMLHDGKMADVFLHFHNADLELFDAEANFCMLNDEQWVSDLTDSAKAYCTDADGNLLGLPYWESSVSGCYYNTKIFADNQLDAAATQEEFNARCALLKRKGITPICWPADGCSWMIQFGMDPIFADNPDLLDKLNANEITYADIPQMTAMLEWLDSAEQNGWFGDDALKTGWDDISEALSSGKAAMTFIWDTWFYTDFTDGKYTKDDFALMPVFMNTAETGTYEGGNLNMMMVYKNSPRKDEALEFLNFCATPANYNVAFNGISTVSVFRGQTTNIQSKMVLDAAASIAAHERVSTASTKIIGYSADKVANAVHSMFANTHVSVTQCLKQLDTDRINEAKELGAKGF